MGRLPSDLYRLSTTFLGWLVMAAFSLLWGILTVPPTLLLTPIWPRAREIFSDVTSYGLRLYIRSLMFLRVRVEGEGRRVRGPRILIANHQSWLDPIILIGLERRLGGPIQRYMLRFPGLGAIIRLSGFFAIDVEEFSYLDQIRSSAELARARGGGLLFFPEGTRSRTGEVGSFHRGACRAAVDYDLPVQPIVIEGLDRILPPGHVIAQTPGRQIVRIRYLEPIEPPFGTGIRRDIVRALTERVRSEIVEELGKLRTERASASRSSAGEVFR